MKREPIPEGSIDVERSTADVFALHVPGMAPVTIRRGADGWKLWLRSCAVEIAEQRYRTQAAMWKPEVSLVDQAGVVVARDTLSGTRHIVELDGELFVGDGTHDIERWQTGAGEPLLVLQWSGGYPELARIEVRRPIGALTLAALAAFAVHAGSKRGGDRQSW